MQKINILVARLKGLGLGALDIAALENLYLKEECWKGYMPGYIKTFLFASAIAANCIPIASCGGASTHTAQYRIVQTIPDSPGALDISLNGQNVFTNADFGAAMPAAGYQAVSAGGDPIEVSQSAGNTPVIGSTNLNFQSGRQYTVVLTGLYASASVASFADDNTSPLAGQVELRVIHASPSAPRDVDVYIVAPGTDITQIQPAVAALPFQQQSLYIPLSTLKSGNVEALLIVTAAGSKTQLLTQDYILTDGQIRTFVLVDVSPQANALSFTPLELNDLN